MLEYMRKNANSTVVWLIIGAISLVFVFFGIGGGGHNYKNITVNGEEIDFSEFDRVYGAISRAQTGDVSPEQVKEMKKSAASAVVEQRLMEQFGRKAGLTPTDWAVARDIATHPEFQVDGRFDKARYEAALAAMRMNKSFFERNTRRELLTGRLTGLVAGLSQASPPEVMEAFHFQEDLLAFNYLFFPAEPHRAGLNPGDGDLAAYYALNQEKWRRPASMTIEYVEFRPADFLDQAQVNEAELREAYNDNAPRFTSPESADVEHILFRFPKMNPDPEEKQKTLERAEAAYERAKTENFNDLARELSEDPGSAPAGGSLGPIGRGVTFDNFEKVVFSAPIGEVSPPVETDIGYHLIKVVARQEAGPRSFDEVRATLESEQKAFKAREMAVQQMEDLLIRTETNPKLADAAASMGLTVKTSERFTETKPLDFFTEDPSSLKKAFSAPLGRVAPPVETENHLVVYAPLERQESLIPPLDEVRAEVTQAWINAEAGRLAEAEARGFLQKAAETGWAEAAAAWPQDGPIRRGRSPLANRTSLLGAAPFDKVNTLEFFAAIHSVAQVGQVSPLTVSGEENGASGCFALSLSDFQKADEGLLKGPAGEAFTSMLSMNKGYFMLETWRRELFNASQSEIFVPVEYLN